MIAVLAVLCLSCLIAPVIVEWCCSRDTPQEPGGDLSEADVEPDHNADFWV